MTSWMGHVMNFIFLCGREADPAIPRDYVAERRQNAKQPGGNLRGIMVKEVRTGRNSAGKY
ncbi:MAG: hypothetical protein LIV24_11080 [Eubacterium sp.]|nr:hypothetical protein [Eubacterium sp.]